MNHRDVEDLLRLPERFVDGERTKPVADEIEGLIVNCFQDEPWFDDTSYALARSCLEVPPLTSTSRGSPGSWLTSPPG